LIPNQTKFRSPTSVTSVCKNELSMPGFTIPEKKQKKSLHMFLNQRLLICL
jgi:hypothetical protein